MIKKQYVPGALAAVVALAAFTLSPLAQASGLTVAKDPVTGQLRAPTAEEAAALQPAKETGKAARGAQAPRGLLTGRINPQPVYHPDGTVEQELDESSQSFTVMTRNADGTMSMACVDNQDEALALVSGKKQMAKSTKSTKGQVNELK